MSKQSWLSLGMIAAGMLVTPGRASACDQPPRSPVIFPRQDDVSPTNTHVWVFLQRYWRPSGTSGARAFDAENMVVTVRREDVGGEGPTAEAETRRTWSRHEFGSGNIHVTELVPSVPLQPRSNYVISLRWGEAVAESVRFETGEGPDDDPPRWLGVDSVLVKSTSAAQAKFCDRCPDPGEPWVELAIKQPSDDATPEPEILYAVWLPDAQGHLDETKAPTTLLRRRPLGRLVLGVDDDCVGAVQPTAALKPRKGPFKAVLRAVDLAGHQGPRVEIKTDLR
jgi:hypothetical protein